MSILIIHKYWFHFLVILIAASFLMFSSQSVHSRDPHFHLCCQPGQFLAGAHHSHHPVCHFHSLPHGHHPLHPRPVLSGRRLGQPRPAHPAEGPAEHPGHYERALQRPGRWDIFVFPVWREHKHPANGLELFSYLQWTWPASWRPTSWLPSWPTLRCSRGWCPTCPLESRCPRAARSSATRSARPSFSRYVSTSVIKSITSFYGWICRIRLTTLGWIRHVVEAR